VEEEAAPLAEAATAGPWAKAVLRAVTRRDVVAQLQAAMVGPVTAVRKAKVEQGPRPSRWRKLQMVLHRGMHASLAALISMHVTWGASMYLTDFLLAEIMPVGKKNVRCRANLGVLDFPRCC
jgi:hypothetical protein